MKNRLIIFILFLSAGIIWAQKNSFTGIPADNVIHNYLTEVQTYATLYSGKTETPYDKRYENHPYFETFTYQAGTLGYNHVVYTDILMRFDLYRNELTVVAPGRPVPVILNNDKFDYAILNGSTIIQAGNENNAKGKFLVLLRNGTYPVARQYNIRTEEETSNLTIIHSFRIQVKYLIYKNGVPYTVKNKNSVLKLFPDKRKELNMFAKQHRLNFNSQIEQCIIALVDQYEAMIND